MAAKSKRVQNGKVRSSKRGVRGSRSRANNSSASRSNKAARKASRKVKIASKGARSKTKKEALSADLISKLYRASDWGREVKEPSNEPWRSEARRDYSRIVHSPSFRRLQGKTQLFPGNESDFFRNRLTHSLEVAQIAESIAHRLNATDPFFKKNPIDPRVCFSAGLMHDMGHPPFGHNGEKALDDSMREFGGFEGNAQTLRIIAKIEKKKRLAEKSSNDSRIGLNLTYRSLGSILKYDKLIPSRRSAEEGLKKGYYADQADLVGKIKNSIAPNANVEEFKTIECAIMDIADDIAYSTYDLEDSLKAGFLSPSSILASNGSLLDRVAKKVKQATGRNTTSADIVATFWDIFQEITAKSDLDDGETDALYDHIRGFKASQDLAESGYKRSSFTSQLVGEFIGAVEVLEINKNQPALSKVELSKDARFKVEVLKNYTFEATISSTRLKLAEYRGYEVVKKIFDALSGARGHLLMPDDVRDLYRNAESNATSRQRVVCDFVAGMTDRYAVEFYARLHSDNPQSIFKPA